jgi:hypothetical protein
MEGELQPGAVAFLQGVDRLAIVSNNSTMTRVPCAARLG